MRPRNWEDNSKVVVLAYCIVHTKMNFCQYASGGKRIFSLVSWQVGKVRTRMSDGQDMQAQVTPHVVEEYIGGGVQYVVYVK